MRGPGHCGPSLRPGRRTGQKGAGSAAGGHGLAPSESSAVLRQSGLLLAARALQAMVGAASFLLATRQLGPERFGELVTAFGLAAVLGGIVGAALSDAAVVAGSQLVGLGPAIRIVVATSAATPLVAALFTGADVTLALLGTGLFVAASAASAGRTAWARQRGNARGLAIAQGVGALTTLVLTGALVASSVESWGAYVVAYSIQPAAMLALSRPPRPPSSAPFTRPLRQVLRLSAPFLVSQSVWPVLAQVNVFVLRALEGPGAVGRYGVLVRVLDLVAVGAPLLGTFALPAFARLQAGPEGASARSRLNLALGAVSTVPVVASMPFGWLVWQLAYEDLRFPAVAFAILAGAYGLSNSCGLPDRALQATGRSPVVARSASVALAALLVTSPVAVGVAGLGGAAVALLLAVGGVNLAMLQRTRPTGAAVVGHAWIAGVVALCGTVVALRGQQRSLVVSAIVAAVAVVGLAAGAAAAHRRTVPAERAA